MIRNFINFGKIAAVAIAVMATSCSKDDSTNGTPDENGSGSGSGSVTPTTTEKPTAFNVIHRVAGTGALSDWSFQPLKEAEMKSGEITFTGKGYNLAQDRTHQMFSTNNGNTIYVYSSMSRLLTKYETTGDDKLYAKKDELDLTPIVGNTFANFKVIDENNALVYVATPQHLTKTVDKASVYSETVTKLSIGRINLETFNAVLKEMKTITLPKIEQSAELLNTHIAGVEHPVLVGGKLYFGVRKAGYDPTKTGRAANLSNEDAFNTSTFVLDYPSFTNPQLITSTVGKGSSTYPSVFYVPSYVKTENNTIFHANPLKGTFYKLTNGAYDASYEFSLKTALGETADLNVSGIFYAANNIAYVAYAPASAVLAGGLKYADGKAAWKIARVDLNAKTATKMNVPDNLWLTFHQTAKYFNGKLYMALCPMTGDGNVYIFDPTKADANGFEKGATLKSAGGAIYLGVF